MEYSTAAHPNILRYDARTGECSEIGCANLPLGLFAGQTFTKDTLECAPGDVLLLLTDGLLEIEDDGGKEFGVIGVKTVLTQHATKPLETIFQALLQSARRYGPTTDDQTILLVRCHSNGE